MVINIHRRKYLVVFLTHLPRRVLPVLPRRRYHRTAAEVAVELLFITKWLHNISILIINVSPNIIHRITTTLLIILFLLVFSQIIRRIPPGVVEAFFSNLNRRRDRVNSRRRQWRHDHSLLLLLCHFSHVGSPKILYFVIRSSRKLPSNSRPSAKYQKPIRNHLDSVDLK